VLNASPRVSPQAVDAVLAAVAALGYQPNPAARALVTRRTGTVAVVVSEPGDRFFDDPHFARLIRTAAQELPGTDRQMVLMLLRSPEDQARARQFLAGGHVDGALVFTPHRDDLLPAVAADLPLPMVFGGRPWGNATELYTVDNDNSGGGRLATEHLLGLGRSLVTTVAGPADELAAEERFTAWREALGLSDEEAARRSARGDFTRDGGERAMAELIERVPDLDAVFAASDLMAAGALRVLRQVGRRVPEDVAVVGFDDNPMVAPHTEPPLTSVRQDPVTQMRRMVARLDELLAGNESGTHREVLPVELVRRESA
jgi:DNA-binding LacI/PurR family transcriptional regulator